MTFVWIAAIVIFGIAEAATAGLVSIWFVAGAVAALLENVCGEARLEETEKIEHFISEDTVGKIETFLGLREK